MGGEQAATVLATITKDQRAREGKEVMTPVNHAVRRSAGEPWKITVRQFAAKIINIMNGPFLEARGLMRLLKGR